MRAAKDNDYRFDYNRKEKRAQERIHLSVQFDMEETEWYGYGAAGVLGLEARNRGFNQPVAAYANGSEHAFSGKGISRGAAFAMITALVALLAVLVFSNLFAMTDAMNRVNLLQEQLDAEVQIVQGLQQELSVAKKNCDIAYLAPQLGMHRETAKDTVYLTVQ